MSQYNDFLTTLKSNAEAGRSRLNLRNEKAQIKMGSRGLARVTKDKNKKSKILIISDLAIPFNPLSAEQDSIYNEDTKFRPEKSYETTLKTLKLYYNDEANAELKTKFLEMIGADEWDTSNPDVITEQDKNIFYKYKFPRVFSHNVVKVISPILNKVEFACDYQVPYKRDELGDIIVPEGEQYPLIARLSSLYFEIYMEKYKQWESQNQAASDKAKKEEFKKIMSACPVSTDFPSNTALVVELPLNSTLSIDNLGEITVDDLKKHISYIKYSGTFQESLKELRETYASTRDVYPDFYELDMLVGDEEDKMLRGKNTKFNNAECPIRTIEGYDKFLVNLEQAIDELERQEELITKAVARKKIDENTLKKVTEALAVEQKFEDIEGYLTQQIGDKYADLLDLIYGKEADDFLLDSDDGEAPESALSAEEKDKFAKDMKSILEETDLVDDTIIDDEEDDE